MSYKLSTQEISKISLLESIAASFGFTVGSAIFLAAIKDPLSIPCFIISWIVLFIAFFAASFVTWQGGTKGVKRTVTLSAKEISFNGILRHIGFYAIIGVACWAVLYFISR